MNDLNNTGEIREMNLLIAFSDLTAFTKYAGSESERTVFNTMSDYCEFVGDIIEKAKGRVIKFIGDAAMIVFLEKDADRGVRALKELKDSGDRWMESRKIPSRHHIKAHFGSVVCGPIGTRTEKKFDIYGMVINTTALLKTNGFAITPQVFRKLEPETRKLFKKHTPPVSYIPIEESHRD